MILHHFDAFWQSSYRKDWQIRFNTFFALAVNLFTWFILYYRLSPFAYLTQSGNIPLHFNAFFGIDHYGKWYSTLALPLVGLIVIIFNTAMAYRFYNEDRLLSLLFVYFLNVTNIILCAASIYIILLNL